ncbi:hypothetical protein BAU24_10350 [Bacillus sp. L27]|nr:hypothetical protein BAU24_10350 [Bacillus sp. L27]
MKRTTELVRVYGGAFRDASHVTRGIALKIKMISTQDSLSGEILFNCLFSTTRIPKCIRRLWINLIQINKKGTLVCLFIITL